MPAQYPWLELGKYLLISVIEDQRLVGFNNVMRIVARLLVLLPLLWVEGVWAVDCPTGTTTWDSDTCLLPPNISFDMTLISGVDYLMEGRVTVGNGNGQLTTNNDGTLPDGSSVRNVTLTIEAGVEIKGKQGTFANLVITRGSKIMAMGTKTAPIIMSSEDAGYSGSGEWGGLIIHGYAPHNECQVGGTYCDIDSEGESGFAGGYDADDNSGVLNYVVVAEGGYEFSTGNEINVISLIGVGRGTEIDFIQVHGGDDDGIEIYGGTANIKHGVFTDNSDDSVDWDEGYQGNMQYIIVKQQYAKGEAFEMDTQGALDGFLSKPTVANVTIINDKVPDRATYSLRFRKSSGGFFHNTVVTVADSSETAVDTCIDVSGSGSEALVGTALVINNWIQDCGQGQGVHGTLSGPNVSFDASTVVRTDALLDSSLASKSPSAVLTDAVDWLAFNASYPESVADPDFFDATNYIGAVNPDGSDIWWAGWTLSGTLPSLPALDVPASPTITSTDYEDGKIILKVSVSDNGGTDITGYDATCTDGTNTYTGTSTSSPITVSGLTNDVPYTCTVTATNSVGTSSVSAATDPITPEETATGLPIWLLYQATQ